MKTRIAILRDALVLLKQRGWGRGTLEDCDGKLCLSGAINLSATGKSDGFSTSNDVDHCREEFHIAFNLVRTALREKGYSTNIPHFNDSQAGDVEVVESVLKAALDKVAKA